MSTQTLGIIILILAATYFITRYNSYDEVRVNFKIKKLRRWLKKNPNVKEFNKKYYGLVFNLYKTLRDCSHKNPDMERMEQNLKALLEDMNTLYTVDYESITLILDNQLSSLEIERSCTYTRMINKRSRAGRKLVRGQSGLQTS